MKILLAPIAGAFLLAAASPAFAQTTPAPSPARAADPAKLAEAHAVVDIMYPPATRQQMLDKMLDQLIGPIRQGMPTDGIKDPGLKALFTEYVDHMLAGQRTLLAKHMPAMTEAMATAYADQLTLPELKDLHAFASSPSGRSFFARMSTILGDPAVQKVMIDMAGDAKQMAQDSLGEFKEKVAAYVNAHPEAEEQLKTLGQSKGT